MKTVKIFFEKALTLLLMVIGAVSLASCGDDDDVTEPTATVKKVEIIVNIEPTQDMLDYCKMTLVYTDDSGQSPQAYNVDKLSNKVLMATLTKFPVTGKVELFSEPKEGVSFPAEKTMFSYQHKYNISFVKYYSNGKSQVIGSTGNTNINPLNYPVDKMEQWFSKYGQHKLHSFAFDASAMLSMN